MNEVAYDAQQIQVLEGLEGVRKRPGMYVGSTGSRGLHHLVFEVVDNGVDEALAGYATHIDVVIHKDGSITVANPGVVNSPRWFSPRISRSTSANPSFTYFFATLPLHQVESPMVLKRRISVRTRLRKAASPIQLVTRLHIQDERCGP